MAKYIYKNYHNPYFSKNNPNGEFSKNSNYRGYYYFSNYQGPDFFDDLEVLLALGANPNIKNRLNESVTYLLFKHGYNFLNDDNFNKYFTLIQKYHPHALSFMEIFQVTNHFTNPRFHDERYKEGFNRVYYKTWIEHELLGTLDERWLPLDCLEELVKWIDQGQLKQLGTSDKVIVELRQRLIEQLHYQQAFPLILDATTKLIQCYQAHKDIIIRGMLLNSLEYPLYGLIDQLNNLEREKILTDALNRSLDLLLSDYSQTRKICQLIKLVPIHFNKNEWQVLNSVCESLDNALNGQAYRKANREFDLNTGFEKKFMIARWGLFQEYKKPAQAVQNELAQLFQHN